MIIDFNDIPALSRYHLLTQTVTPRPIAWILSPNDDSSLNLAPFSFFNAVCSDPPLFVVSVGKKTTGEAKDTRRNLLSGREFVVHIPSVDHANAVNNSAATLGYGESEVSTNGLELEPFPGSPVPRLSHCKIAYHCKLYDAHTIGPNEQAMIYGEVLQLYVSDNVIEQDQSRFTIDTQSVNPLCRLGGGDYTGLKAGFSLSRPK